MQFVYDLKMQLTFNFWMSNSSMFHYFLHVFFNKEFNANINNCLMHESTNKSSGSIRIGI